MRHVFDNDRMLSELRDVDVLLEHLEDHPADQLSDVELVACIESVEAIRMQRMFDLLGLVGEADRRGLAVADGARSTAAWLSARLGLGPAEAERLVRRARALDESPADSPPRQESALRGGGR